MKVIVLALILGVSCTAKKEDPTIFDNLKNGLAKEIAKGVAATLQCSNVAAVETSVKQFFGTEKSVVKDVLCSSVVKIMIPVLVSSGVPASWECQLTTINGQIETAINNICGDVK